MKLTLRFEYYSDEELTILLRHRCKALGWPVDEKVLPLIAQRARGVPRLALRLLQACRRVCRSEGEKAIFPVHFERAVRIGATRWPGPWADGAEVSGNLEGWPEPVERHRLGFGIADSHGQRSDRTIPDSCRWPDRQEQRWPAGTHCQRPGTRLGEVKWKKRKPQSALPKWPAMVGLVQGQILTSLWARPSLGPSIRCPITVHFMTKSCKICVWKFVAGIAGSMASRSCSMPSGSALRSRYGNQGRSRRRPTESRTPITMTSSTGCGRSGWRRPRCPK